MEGIDFRNWAGFYYRVFQFFVLYCGPPSEFELAIFCFLAGEPSQKVATNSVYRWGS